MERTVLHRKLKRPHAFKISMSEWSATYETSLFLDSNDFMDPHGSFDALLAVGRADSITLKGSENAFDSLERFRESVNDWIFGYFSYDLKNGVENLKSANADRLDFPELFFFQPIKLFILNGNELKQLYLVSAQDELEIDFFDIENVKSRNPKTANGNGLEVQSRINKEKYIAGAKAMLAHIHRGNIYEANFCQEFFANGKIAAVSTFQKLNDISNAPFAAYFRNGAHHILCTSPERFICKKGNKITSQPIKGTARRSKNPDEDKRIAAQLGADPKERAENIMITDLVRNDLSRIAEKGSVKVEALCEVHPYKQVHQMLSTVSARVKNGTSIPEILKNTFPMGSMTGAPKIAAMQIIENLEGSKRGVYSGTLGYFTPDGNFDFNVIIRSILYNAEREYISFSVGSAITAKADPEKEYEECLLKAKAMREVLSGLKFEV